MDTQLLSWVILILFGIILLLFVFVLFKILSFDKQKSEATLILTPEYMVELEQKARKNFGDQIDQSTEQLSQQMQERIKTYLTALDHGLKDPQAQINQQIVQILDGELKIYAKELAESRNNLVATINQISSDIVKDQSRLKQDLQVYLEKEKANRLEAIDKKMADILAEYLIVSLGSEIDFSSQRDYIFRQLEENKANLREDLQSVG